MRSASALALLFVVLLAVCVGLVGYSTSLAHKPHLDEYLVVNDKPYIEVAEEAQEETYLYEQSYGVETYNSYWYESDDMDAEAAAKEWIAFRESGGDYDARNGQYIGRYQLSADKLDGDWSEENQEATAEQYVQERYGSWSAAHDFWESHGWY